MKLIALILVIVPMNAFAQNSDQKSSSCGAVGKSEVLHILKQEFTKDGEVWTTDTGCKLLMTSDPTNTAL